jgi:hypothetical protein
MPGIIAILFIAELTVDKMVDHTALQSKTLIKVRVPRFTVSETYSATDTEQKNQANQKSLHKVIFLPKGEGDKKIAF